MMGAHWASLNDKIMVATNPNPNARLNISMDAYIGGTLLKDLDLFLELRLETGR